MHLNIVLSVAKNERVVVLCVYVVHACSFNYKSDYSFGHSYCGIFNVVAFSTVYLCVRSEIRSR